MKAKSVIVKAVLLLLAMGATGATGAAADQVAEDEQAGIAAFDRGDIVGAMNFFERAAQAGSPLAQARLAWILDGANDDIRAVALYRAAAEQGYAAGMHGLGEMYAKGEGVEKDHAEAVAWFTKAADAGYEKSLRVLISAYEEGGLGQSADPEKASRLRDQLVETTDTMSAGGEN